MKKKKSAFRRAFNLLFTLCLVAGAGAAAYFMVAEPDRVNELLARVLPRDTAPEERPPAKDGRAEKRPPAEGPGKKAPSDPAGVQADPSAAGPAADPAGDPPRDIASGPRTPAGPESSTAARALEKARASYRIMDFDRTLEELERIPPGALDTDDAILANRLERWSRDFLGIVAGVEPLELADAAGIVVLHLKNGRKVEGRILKQEGGILHLQKNHGIKWPVRLEEVGRIEKVPQEDVLAARGEEFRKVLKSSGALTALRAFELVEYCIREGLRDQVTPLLEKGMELDPQFPLTVYNEKAKRVYRLFLWYKGKKKDTLSKKHLEVLEREFPKSYFTARAHEDEQLAAPKPRPVARPEPDDPEPAPEPKPAPAMPKSPLEGFPEEPAPEPEPEPPVPAGKSLMDLADQAYRRARVHEENSFPGKPNADEENRKAIETYEKAIALYERAQEKHPDQAAFIEGRLEEMYASLFWCKKRQTLD